MRYVDIALVELPNGWLRRSQNAAYAVAGGADPDVYADVWRELKSNLADLLHDKCWYCEVSVERSDNAVDHFRPKGRVSDATNVHPGYRWLAFDRYNFRYSCTFCNSRRKDVKGGTAGGKGDRFPLIDENSRVYEEGPIELERPILLDPCIYSDCQLLGCQKENGRPCVASTEAIDKRRAEESIQIYHLHHEPTCKRRHAKAVGVLADLDEGKRKFTLASRDPARAAGFQGVAKRLLRLISSSSEFSGEMRFLMRGERSEEHPWIQRILESLASVSVKFSFLDSLAAQLEFMCLAVGAACREWVFARLGRVPKERCGARFVQRCLDDACYLDDVWYARFR